MKTKQHFVKIAITLTCLAIMATMLLVLVACANDTTAPTVEINADGYWVINGVVTDVLARGQNGKDGKDGTNGLNGTDGVDGVGIAYIESAGTSDDKEQYVIHFTDGTTTTFDLAKAQDGADGADGKDGKDGTDGLNGSDGVGISDVVLTDSEGLVDVYTIHYTDGQSTTFEVQNGRDGQDANYTIHDVYDAFLDAYAAKYQQAYTGDFVDFIQTYFAETYQQVNSDSNVASNVLSCVSVYSSFDVTYYTLNPFYGYQQYTQRVSSAGAGVIYSLDKDSGSAYIITNYHVVYNNNAQVKISDDIFVLLYGYEQMYTVNADSTIQYTYTIPATFVGGSMQLDIAVLYVENSNILKYSDARAVVLGDSNQLAVGQDAIAIGNPEAEGISVTRGIISVDSENLTMVGLDESRYVNFRVIRVDTSINSGNSGGGLFDAYGRLIGIVNAKMNSSAAENIAYAIPVNVAKWAAQSVIDRHVAAGKTGVYSVYRAQIGFIFQITAVRSYYDYGDQCARIAETVTISDPIDTDSVAYGLLDVGDVIRSVTIRGTTISVTRYYMFSDALLLANVGDVVTIEYTRGGQSGTVDITIAAVEDVDTL